MKKILALIAVAAMSLSLIACGSSNSGEKVYKIATDICAI